MRVMEDVDIGLLIEATLPLVISGFIVVVTMVEVDIGIKIPATLYLKIVEFIILLTMVEIDPGLNIPANLTITIAEQELVLMLDGYIYHNSHSYPHSPGGRGRLFSLSVSSCPDDDHVHE